MTRTHSPDRTSPIILSGLAAAISFWLSVAFSFAMDFGGGSLIKGLPNATGYLSLYGISLLAPAIVIGFVAIVISKLLGLRVTYALIGCGAAAIMIHSMITSHPGAQLERLSSLSNKTEIPHFDYLEFKKYPTFNDGTTYTWQVRCNPEQARLLASRLRLMQIPRESSTSDGGILWHTPYSRLSAFESIFEHRVPDEIHYTDDLSFAGGFSPAAAIFRLVWFPEGRLAPSEVPDAHR